MTVLLTKRKAWLRLAGLRLKHYDFPTNSFFGSATSSRRRRYACTPSFNYSFIIYSLLFEFNQKSFSLLSGKSVNVTFALFVLSTTLSFSKLLLFTNYHKRNAALQFSIVLRSFSANITTNGQIIPRKKLNWKNFKKRTPSPIRFHLWTRSFFFSFVFYFQFKLSVLSPDFLDKKFAGKSWVWNEWLIKSDEGASKVFLATSLQKGNSSF